MSLDITGKLVTKLPQQSGQGKNGAWIKQDFIVETQEQFPKKVCISLWGEKAKELDSIAIGETMKIGINIESREFNGKWYTDVKAWKIKKAKLLCLTMTIFLHSLNHQTHLNPQMTFHSKNKKRQPIWLPFFIPIAIYSV